MTTIVNAVDELPATSVTTHALTALDFAVPGEWHNIVGFENTVRETTGLQDPAAIKKVTARAQEIYRDPKNGYQRALWIYQTIDTADKALGAAAMANKVGERLSFLSFLNRLTPKADTTQSIDLGIKVVGELIAFTLVQGLPTSTDSIGPFTVALAKNYRGDALMRMVALACFDGVIPLGPDFTRRVGNILGGLTPSQLDNNPVFKSISEMIPGSSEAGKLGFINDSFMAAQGWMDNFISTRNITPEKITGNLHKYIDFADDKLDYLAAFLDMTTNYYAHTGTQTLAKNLITRAASEV